MFHSVERTVAGGAAMEKELADAATPSVLSFECETCGQSFESWPRLRQHQVDCQTEDFDSQA
jgi:hypothetical protein